MTEATTETIETTETTDAGILVSQQFLTELLAAGAIIGTVLRRGMQGLESSNALMLAMADEYGLIERSVPSEELVAAGAAEADEVLLDISPALREAVAAMEPAGDDDSDAPADDEAAA